MAGRNTIREFDAGGVYHVYNRGVEKRRIFQDTADYEKFLAILARHLDGITHADSLGRPYEQYDIDLLAYCLMPNHFHVLVSQGEDPEAFTKLLRSVSTAYTMYFNRKYKRVGHLFQERFKAVRVTNDSYYQHISRYIHLNPAEPFRYKWSSLRFYLGQAQSSWLNTEPIMSMFHDARDYEQFVRDYEGQKIILDELKHQLADR